MQAARWVAEAQVGHWLLSGHATSARPISLAALLAETFGDAVVAVAISWRVLVPS